MSKANRVITLLDEEYFGRIKTNYLKMNKATVEVFINPTNKEIRSLTPKTKWRKVMSRAKRILEELEKGEKKKMKKMLQDLEDMLKSLSGEMSKSDQKFMSKEIKDLENTMQMAA